ncbi:MAG: inorganic diphosphatase [Gemmatimonadota bacterium]|jgi:inorganic pyrophosphatase|nr:inorganic diphosphatase [Gemmatimonadota bacterium]
MIHPWHDLPPGPNPPDQMTVVVEIPRGSRNKYELNKRTGLFRLDRVLFSAVHYPGDYGFFPQTYAEDDDPLDALVMITVPTFPACEIDVRPLGMFRMSDRDEMDEKVLCVPLHDPLYDDYETISDVPSHFLREVEHFFTVYKDLEGGRVRSLGWEDRQAARAVIQDSTARYALKQKQEEILRISAERPRRGLEL